MKNAKHIDCILRYLFIIVLSAAGFSLDLQAQPSRQSALDQFSKGNYETAYNQFIELSSSYPRDPLYKYYCGVSLVKLEKDPLKASVMLRDAKLGSSGIKTVPADVSFYLGRALQMTGNFSEAINSYKEFSDQAGKKASRDYQTAKYIQECNEKKGALMVSSAVNKLTAEKDSLTSGKTEKGNVNAASFKSQTSDTLTVKEGPPPAGYVNLLNEALNYQCIADSLALIAISYRDQMATLPNEAKANMKARISETEKSALINQKKADEKMLLAKKFSHQNSIPERTAEQKNHTDSTSSVTESLPVANQQSGKVVNDSANFSKKEGTFEEIVGQNRQNKGLEDTVNKKDTLKLMPPLQVVPEIFSVFEINTKQSFSPDEKVPVNTDGEPGLIYRIQVAVFRNPVSPAYFKGITPVYGFRNEGSDVTIYYAGMFRKSADATKALIKVKSAGFRDAFIVALMDKKIISQERASVLEKVWGKRPFPQSGIHKTNETARDTIPPTLMFRVEAAKVKKPLTDEQVDNLKRFAGNKGLDIIKNGSGLTIYLIGKFLTFESAAEYADLLTLNGYKEARVSAYLGTREIPVETARQLFEKY